MLPILSSHLLKKVNSQKEQRMDMLEYSLQSMDLARSDSGNKIFHGASIANITQMVRKSFARVFTKDMVMLAVEPRSLLQTIKARSLDQIE